MGNTAYTGYNSVGSKGIHTYADHVHEDVTPDAVYRAACRRQGVLAAEFVCTALREGRRLVVSNRQLTKREAKALAIALVVSIGAYEFWVIL